MINVTGPNGRTGYEFLPHGQRFAKPVEVVIPYDAALIPEEMKPDDVHIYYFDPKAERWKKLERRAVDVGDRVIRSATDHYTIMIAATISVPKNPAPLSLDPTAMTSIAAATPAANIDLIAPPQASSTGDARVALPIRLPSSRGAYSPSVAISYASSGGNGWVGQGWDVSLSRVEIDSRFGVPTYAADEQPRYLLDGAQLVPTLETDGPTCQDGSPGRRYRARIEGAFSHILRCDHAAAGVDPTSRYGWEVHDRNGTLYVYGVEGNEDPDTDLRHTVLSDPQRTHGIFRWHLRKVIDVHGNWSKFSYTVDNDDSAQPGREVYPSSISYTGHDNKAPAYSVEFHLDAEPALNTGARPDRIVSGRAGFKTTTRRLLRRISVKFQSGIVRDYVLTYKHGQFDKTLLETIAVYGVGGCNASGNAFQPPGCSGAAFFNKHELKYVHQQAGFAPVTPWFATGTHSTVPTLTQSTTTAYSGSVSFGVAEGIDVSASLARAERREEIGLYDVNGDHLPDQLFAEDRTGVR